ncbi:MAG: hypothetical protein AABZ64_04280 [Nitrospinota bacterium]
MTILVGVLCEDGVVIGADSAATFQARQIKTVEQPTQKIRIIGEQVIVATTGPVGLGQRFEEVVSQGLRDKVFGSSRSPVQVAREICKRTIIDFDETAAPKGQLGALVAFCHNDKHCLVEFGVQDFQPEMKNENLWYVAMGSGQLIADPFLGLMRKVFCPERPPSLSTGTFISTWTLFHTIEVNPGGIKEPIILASLARREDRKYRAQILDDKLLNEHRNNVTDAYAYLTNYAEILTGKSGEQELPAPPSPPAPGT